MRKLLIILVLLAGGYGQAAGQGLISTFKENYAVTGIPLNAAPDWDTNDLSYQVSLRFNVLEPLCRDGWDVFPAYTQLSIWDVYKPSNPFRSSIYSFGLYASRGEMFFGIEHRSNGYDSYESRTINAVFASWTRDWGRWLTTQLTARIGIGEIGNTTSLEMFTRYQGYGCAAVCFHTPDRRLMATASVTPLFGSDIPCNAMAELAWRPTPRVDWLYLTARWHYGYDENHLDCALPDVFLKSMLRFGLSIQPENMAHKLFW